MTIAEDLVLLVTEPATGKFGLSSMVSDVTLGGAILVDLLQADRVEVQGEGRKARVALRDRSPSGAGVTDRAIRALQASGPLSAQSALKVVGKRQKRPLYEALAAAGVVRRVPHKVLGVFPTDRWPLSNTARRNDLVRRLRQILVHRQPADSHTGPLIGLLSAADKLGLIVEKPDRPAAKARAKVVAGDDWADDEVRKAIAAANAAVLLAVIAATSAATGAGAS